MGEIKDGECNGKGTFIYPDGRRYVGEFKDGEPNGQGSFTWSNGKKYVGEFKDGVISGRGTSSLHDSVMYEGGFYDSEFHGHGHGTHTSPEGYICIGVWKACYIWNGTTYNKGGNITEKYVNGVNN